MTVPPQLPLIQFKHLTNFYYLTGPSPVSLSQGHCLLSTFQPYLLPVSGYCLFQTFSLPILSRPCMSFVIPPYRFGFVDSFLSNMPTLWFILPRRHPPALMGCSLFLYFQSLLPLELQPCHCILNLEHNPVLSE